MVIIHFGRIRISFSPTTGGHPTPGCRVRDNPISIIFSIRYNSAREFQTDRKRIWAICRASYEERDVAILFLADGTGCSMQHKDDRSPLSATHCAVHSRSSYCHGPTQMAVLMHTQVGRVQSRNRPGRSQTIPHVWPRIELILLLTMFCLMGSSHRYLAGPWLHTVQWSPSPLFESNARSRSSHAAITLAYKI